jgi:hypothetical protein
VKLGRLENDLLGHATSLRETNTIRKGYARLGTPIIRLSEGKKDVYGKIFFKGNRKIRNGSGKEIRSKELRIGVR